MKYVLCLIAVFSFAQAMDEGSTKLPKARKTLPPHLRERSLKANSRQLIQKNAISTSNLSDEEFLQSTRRDHVRMDGTAFDHESTDIDFQGHACDMIESDSDELSPRKIRFSDEERSEDHNSLADDVASQTSDSVLFEGSTESSDQTRDASDDESTSGMHDYTLIQDRLSNEQKTLLMIVCKYALIKLAPLSIELDKHKRSSFEKNLHTLLTLSYRQTKIRLQHFDLDALLKNVEETFAQNFSGSDIRITVENSSDAHNLKYMALYVLYICEHMDEIIKRIYLKVRDSNTQEYTRKDGTGTKSIVKALIADVDGRFYREARISNGPLRSVVITTEEERAAYAAKFPDCTFDERDGKLYCTYSYSLVIHRAKSVCKEYEAKLSIILNGQRY